MTTFLTPLTTQMASSSSLGGVVVILLLVILIVESELIRGAREEHARRWLEIVRVATLPLFFAFSLIMLARLSLMITR